MKAKGSLPGPDVLDTDQQEYDACDPCADGSSVDRFAPQYPQEVSKPQREKQQQYTCYREYLSEASSWILRRSLACTCGL